MGTEVWGLSGGETRQTPRSWSVKPGNGTRSGGPKQGQWGSKDFPLLPWGGAGRRQASDPLPVACSRRGLWAAFGVGPSGSMGCAALTKGVDSLLLQLVEAGHGRGWHLFLR